MARSGRVSKQSDLWSGIPTAVESLTSTGPTFRSSTMYASLPNKPYPPLGVSRYYREDFHASLTQLQENVKQAATSAIYGKNLPASFAKLLPDGSWQKMSRGFGQVNLDGSLEEFSRIWPEWGIMFRGCSSELTRSEHPTYESEFSFWPTPTVDGSHNRKGASKNSGDGLSTAVKYSLWPTPTTRDYTDGKLQAMLNVGSRRDRSTPSGYVG